MNSTKEACQSAKVRLEFDAEGGICISEVSPVSRYVKDCHGWLRAGTFQGAYLVDADGFPINVNTPLTVLIEAWGARRHYHLAQADTP